MSTGPQTDTQSTGSQSTVGRALTEGLRVGLIGAGGISRVHADAWRALGAIGYVTSAQGASAIAEEYGFEAVDDVDALIGLVDVVDIVTPSSTHADFALRAIGRGRHVVCEKPLAATAEDAAAVVRAAEEAGVRLFPAHVVRYFGEYKAIKDAIDAGRIGTVAVQRFSRAGSAPRTPWFFSESTGGGVIRDLMVHDIDQAVWFAGPVASVYAVQNPPTVDDRVPAPVTAHVVLTHRSSVVSHLHASWVAEGMPFRTSVEVAGSEGRLRYDSAEEAALRADAVLAEGSADYLPPMSPQESPYYAEIADFVAVIRDGGEARISPADGVEAVAIAEAAYASIAAGAPITLADPTTPPAAPPAAPSAAPPAALSAEAEEAAR
ncbi:myo-inositol 2-dehydrogenase/D-chiro-inositol 1-dehydrogenase [Microbacterium resistens]|uniref:Myo-inositol 2-dehydrogenase/D-chiro-inositol 1-dehydrogenase n=1 Tax=Microbacterium resistens TaxID=156977 RepID=A0ABU1SBU5_9MICO|nr:Gfo/Idh/MocA family oxidoreductase [Microbacterium resistens]MDR6867077.1 myo-inositol 2-dehydrogenase/D-chiro-inositol 1-dehydrogenase [Microbacterium resistens]